MQKKFNGKKFLNDGKLKNHIICYLNSFIFGDNDLPFIYVVYSIITCTIYIKR